MTETSIPWPETGGGDAGTYSDDQWSDIWRKLYTLDRAEEGVINGFANELAVSGVTSPVSIATGAALVDGKYYESTAAETKSISTPTTGNSRIDVIVLRKGWVAQTVRIAVVAGTQAPSPTKPAITQSDGTTWDVELAELIITDAGNITVTDNRHFAVSSLSSLRAPPLSVTIVSGAITIQHGTTDVEVTNEGTPAVDILTTINGGYTDQVITLRPAPGDEVQLDHGAGNLALARDQDWWLIDVDRYIMLKFDGSNWVELFPGSQRFTEIAFIIDGAGTVIAAEEKTGINIPIKFDAEILAQQTVADVSGTIEIDLWVDSFANYPPTVADTIVASAPISLSSAIKDEDTTLTGWTTRLLRGDWMRPDVATTPAPATITAVTVLLEVTKL